MASFKEILNNLKNKAETIFYDPGEADGSYGYAESQADAYADQGAYQQQPYQQYAEGAYQQPQQQYHQAAYQQQYQQAAYQQPQQQYQQAAYQQPQQQYQQAAYQQPQQQYQQAAYQQPQQQYQQAAYQQPQQQYQQAAYQQPQQQYSQEAPRQDDPKVVPFPNAQQPQQEGAVATACVINARNVSECYSAIVQLRSGNMVIVVLENITDKMELRHYVDMLSGACYALKGTITKLSRYGSYLIAPNQISVRVDAATNQFNSAASRMQRPQMPFQQMQGMQQQTGYAQQPMQNDYQRPIQQGAAEQSPMYSRPVSPDPMMGAQQSRPSFNGHVPDMPLENAQ